MASKSQKIGLITATSLVVGNMIGSGIFVLPATLAKYGSISLLGWLFTAAGALVLAKIFSNLSKVLVNKSGGPYVFAKEGFGDFIGFLVAWGYWISCWVVNAGIAVAIISALTIFFPILETNSLLAVLIGLGFIWFFTWINIKGVKTSGKFQVVTTILKLLPLVVIIILGFFFFSLDNFPEFNISGQNNLQAFSAVATLTLFAFLGIECATIPAENVKNPEKTVPKATMLGTTITTLVYILGTVVLFGILPIDQLMISPAPFAEAGKIIGGEYTGYFVAAGAAISAIGALNGWILIAGQLPMATARDNMFPRVFKKQNDKEAPYLGLIIGSVLSSIVMLMNFSEGLVDQFEFIALLTTLTALIPYLFVAAAYVIITINKGVFLNNKFKISLLSILGFAYSFWAIYGSGSDTVFYGFLLLLAGVPFYVMMKWNQSKN
ncbi:amino acid permease [Pontimicrobium aquaticum]|uniref:Arginine/agmatine antiporter n=1 Tax=Pontimicrobium aquaticum TaxID=2565367 RepID=A0A4U0F551_9FLAO|nr:amino acid permease [Pontimicrobium aquaticum]TJY37952.1 amino acid permease [Pontimicrobium aquaticum]